MTVPRLSKMSHVPSVMYYLNDTDDWGPVFIDEGENAFYFSTKELKMLRLDLATGYINRFPTA